MNSSRKYRIAVISILAAMAVCISGCTSNPDDNGAGQTTSTEATTTTAPEESSEEETTTTVSEPEESEPEESEPEESEPDEESEPEEDEDSEPASDEVMTQLELITYINQKFGMMLTENTPEGNIDAAKSWNLIDDTFEADEPITPEFTVTAIVRAAVTDADDASLDDMIIIALEKGIIDDANISKLDLTKAQEMTDYAADLWIHGGFVGGGDSGDYGFKETDDVIDLTSMLTSSDLTYNDDGSVSLPADVVEALDLGDNIMLPKDSKGNGGGKYIVTATIIVGSTASIQVEAVE